MPVPYCFDYCSLEYSQKSGSLIPPALFFFLKIALAIRGLLCFHTNLKFFCSSSVKNAIGNLIGIALNLQTALFTIAKTWKQPKCPLTEEWIKKMWYIYVVHIYSAIKKNEIMPFAATWMDLETIILSEVGQRKTNII